jgi:hypothetical protein
LTGFVAYKRRWATVKKRLLPVLFLIALPALAQDATQQPALPEDVQKFLSVPVWYLSYKVSVVSHDGGGGSDGSSWSVNLARVTTGSAQLGIRSQGPSLSMIDGSAPTQGQAFFDAIDRFANWIGGIRPDETKSQTEQDAEQWKVMQANQMAFERFRLESSSEYPEVIAESAKTYQEKGSITESGSAPVTCLADFHLEINGTNKTFKLKFATGFTDSEKSMTAVIGESVQHMGTPNEFHLPIETSMNAGTPAVVSGGPTDGIIEGNLPASFGNLSGSPLYPVRLVRPDGYRGTMTIQFVFSPTPPEPVELIIEPPDDFNNWQPEGGDDEKSAGDYVKVKVHLQKPGGGTPKTKASQFKYRLVDTSREKGVCMNWPLHPVAGNPPYDLQFESSQNPDLVIGDADGQSASNAGEDMTEDKVTISCFDFGAWGDFSAEAELSDGRHILGTVKGTSIEYLKIPERKPPSHIASAFFTEQALGALPDDDDAENDPVGDSFNGDGLTLYEEYRGFMEAGIWTPGNPKKKDVYVLNKMRGMGPVNRGIQLFKSVTGLEVHETVEDNEVNLDRVINFNHTAAPHVTDQHVIRILPGKELAEGANAANVKKVGTPGTAKRVRMPPDWPEFSSVRGQTFEYFAATLAHEMLHSCNIWHHGEADEKVEWRYVPGAPPQIVEVGSGAITVKTEDGTAVDLAAMFPNPTNQTMRVWLGVEHGQHSGHEDCLMRYDCSFAYKSMADIAVRYLSNGERTGVGLCRATAGTGVNVAGRNPQSRYGSAATAANGGPNVQADRGKCKTQLRVNDLGEEPHR